jgi:hypothetical protein
MVTHHATELMPGDVLVRLAAPQAAVRAAVPVG